MERNGHKFRGLLRRPCIYQPWQFSKIFLNNQRAKFCQKGNLGGIAGGSPKHINYEIDNSCWQDALNISAIDVTMNRGGAIYN